MNREERMRALFVIQNEANVDLSINAAAAIFDRLHRSAATLNRLNENRCNYPMSEKEAEKFEKHYDSIRARATKYAAEFGLTLDFGSDPRGAAIRIMTPKTHQYNSWGGVENGWYII